MTTYFDKMVLIARRLLKVFAVALGEEPTFFDQFYQDDNSSQMRLNHYPATENPEGTMGVYHHTAAGYFKMTRSLRCRRSTALLKREPTCRLTRTPTPSTLAIWFRCGPTTSSWHRCTACWQTAVPVAFGPVFLQSVVQSTGGAHCREAWRCGQLPSDQLARVPVNPLPGQRERHRQGIQIGDFKIHGPIDVANS
ncbi:hypothetical protein V7S43_005235 [Phytophthora oleae]|uniref:Uncharacterized protein n=1 Tax=Phytophthora oleae TaxID=2107226 RepID=A0ABD3FSK2_9STRA